MFRKKNCVVAIGCFLTIAGYGQQIYHSIGLSTSVQQATLYRPLVNQGPVRISHLHTLYFPRINFQVGEPSSISVGIPLHIGVGFINNDIFEIKKTFFSYDAGFVIDYNVGFKATPPTDDKFGFYFGTGVGYTGNQLDTLANTKNKTTSFGILARAGIRIGFPDSERNRGITIGAFYKAGLGFERYQTVGLSALFDF